MYNRFYRTFCKIVKVDYIRKRQTVMWRALFISLFISLGVSVRFAYVDPEAVQPAPPKSTTDADVLWLDTSYDFVKQQINKPAQWFDDFFFNESDIVTVVAEEPRLRLRVLAAAKYNEQQVNAYDLRFKLRVDLPKIEYWLENNVARTLEKHLENGLAQSFRFMLSDEAESDNLKEERSRPNETFAEIERSVVGVEQLSGALQWLLDTGLNAYRIDLGARSDYVYVRAKHRRAVDLPNNWVMNVENVVRMKTKEKIDASIQLDFSRKLSPRFVLRQVNRISAEKAFSDASVRHGIFVFQ